METLQYNTTRKQLIIPEYGRHIHKMIELVKEETNIDERNKKAKAIIGVMGNLNPHLRDVPDFQHKLWDQFFIMANFDIEVDSPFDKPQKELLDMKPEKLAYPQNFPKYRFYGNNIKRMIDVAVDWEEGELKDVLVFTIANHMKKNFLSWNKDTVEDVLILAHLEELSGGKLKVAAAQLPLSDSAELIKIKSKNGSGPSSNQSHPRKRNRKRY
ncbi:DUF4290 domain-containing protein [Flavobacteriaceae bacterium]|jgi:hypothetical protein|nr:DUF4290 domain-containing protein [Flavobacteriaceae bacterium]MDA9587766.1 DUF4290 domain-containing protein [Flavobacteriaceae bacterium]MDC0385873.1 DUF4290 domain-containing protein [Flavobacteriaceae bacterium]